MEPAVGSQDMIANGNELGEKSRILQSPRVVMMATQGEDIRPCHRQLKPLQALRDFLSKSFRAQVFNFSSVSNSVMPSSQDTKGAGDECGESSRSSQSRRPPVRLVEGFSHVKQILLDLLENLFGWRSSKDDVPNDQTAKVEDQELVGGSDQRRIDDFVAGGISQASEARRTSHLLENNLGHDGDQRTTMVNDQEWMARSHGQRRDDMVFTIDSTDTSLREWPLLGCNRGTENRRAASHDRDSMQRPHGQSSHCDVVAHEGTAGGSRHSEWAQKLDYLIQQGERKQEAKRKRKERRRRWSSRKQ